MTLTKSVDTQADTTATVVGGDLDVSRLWSHAFPSPDLVEAAAGLLTPLAAWDGSEGPRYRLVFGPGMVQVSRVDPARAERSADRAREAAWKTAVIRSRDLWLDQQIERATEDAEAATALAVGGLVPWRYAEQANDDVDWLENRAAHLEDEKPTGPAVITSWSRKSRARMVRTLAELDYAPLFDGGGTPAMVTLTYPGDWVPVAGSAKACKAHVDALKKRFQRHYGRPLVGVWKREFQRRGAPHYHLLMVPPRERIDGEGFREWLSRTWVEIVAHPDPAERARHLVAGTGIDYAEGMRARDPKRLAVYFSKHGAFAAKDYQNDAPAEWIAAGSVGRFWGFWGLDKATATVEVTPDEAIAAARTMRRWQRANGYRVQREVWRTDTRTGAQYRRKSGTWSGSRMRGHLGFVIVNDGAAFGSALARYLDQVRLRP